MTSSSSTAGKLIKTRLCLISDTHSTSTFPADDPDHPYRRPLPSADILIHSGDLTSAGQIDEYQVTVQDLKDADAELKLVIAGNHDLSLDTAFYAEVGFNFHCRGSVVDVAAVREMWTGKEARDAGIVYLDEGVHRFTLKNGACFTVYASPYTPGFRGGAFAYPRTHDRFNPSPPVAIFQAPNPVPDWPGIDIMITHGPPYGVMDTTYYGKEVGCENLARAVRRCRPRLHVFGHIHEGWGAERRDWAIGAKEGLKLDFRERDLAVRQEAALVDVTGEGGLRWGEETLFVNAAIMDRRCNPRNAPWVVDLELPAGEEV